MKMFDRFKIHLLTILVVLTIGSANLQGQDIDLDVGMLNGGDEITICVKVVVNKPFPSGTTEVCNQGTVSGANFTSLVTDDPDDATSSTDPTCTPVVAMSDLIITEIMYNPNSLEDDWEWVEIYNQSSSTVNLAGYGLDDNNATAHGSANIAAGSIAADTSAILYNADKVTNANFLAAWGTVNLIAVTNWSALALNNGGDRVGLWASFADYTGDNVTHANTVADVDYDAVGFPIPGSGASIYLTNLSADPTIGSNWAGSTVAGATPLFTGYSSIINGTTNLGTDIGSPGIPPDVTAPLISSFSPPDDAVGVALNTNLIVTFNENVQLGSGNILLRKSSDDSIVETFDVATSGQLGVSGAAVTIDPTSDLESSTTYYVTLANGAIEDLAGNPYQGFSGKTVWNFTTIVITDVLVTITTTPENGWDSGVETGAGTLVFRTGPGTPPLNSGSAEFNLVDATSGVVIGTQAFTGTPLANIAELQYSTYNSVGNNTVAPALQFNIDYDLTDATTSWQGRLVFEPYYDNTIVDGTWQTWSPLSGRWWSTGTPVVGDAAQAVACPISTPCTWDTILATYPNAGIQTGVLSGILFKAGSGWPAGYTGSVDEFIIRVGGTRTTVDFESVPQCFVVTNVADAGSGSLRQAILDANANVLSTPDTIKFNIANGGGPHTIQPTSALPDITDPVIIDGATNPDASCGSWPPTLTVELDGTSAGNVNGLTLFPGSAGSLVKGLVINRFRIGVISADINNRFECNFIGTNVAGTSALANTVSAFEIRGAATGNIIGGNTEDKRNLISGNGSGIVFDASGFNVVQGNHIGTDVTGALPLGNQGFGVGTIQPGQLIGGTGNGEGNVIAFNAGDGVAILRNIKNAVLGNSIHSNGGLGINLGEDQVTPNDAGDGDTGANNLQNFPVITSATTDGSGSVTIGGIFNSLPGTADFRLEFFANTVCNGDTDGVAQADNYGEGETFVGADSVDTDGSGDATFSFTFAATVPVGAYITATATSPDSNTSEFAQCVVTVANTVNINALITPTSLLPTFTPDPAPGGPNNFFSFLLNMTNISTETIFASLFVSIDALTPAPPDVEVDNSDNPPERGVGSIYDYSMSLGGDGRLDPGETTDNKLWKFKLSGGFNFTFFANVYGVIPVPQSPLAESGQSNSSSPFVFSVSPENGSVDISRNPTSVRSTESLPEDFSLAQNYPNPFNPETVIRYQLPQASEVKLSIHNLLGQEIRTLVSGKKGAGNHDATWDGKDSSGVQVASGVYLYRMVVKGDSQPVVIIRKMMLMK